MPIEITITGEYPNEVMQELNRVVAALGGGITPAAPAPAPRVASGSR